jgi:DNA replication protein DnaC
MRRGSSAAVDFGFETFGDAQLVAMLDAAQRFAAQLPAMRRGEMPIRWLSLLGTSGAGKTHLAKVIFDCVWCLPPSRPGLPRHPNGGRFEKWARFIGRLKSGEVNINAMIDELCAARFAVLDDFGAERDPSGFSTETFCRVLDGRLGKPTVITSNLLLPQIGELDTRIASRLLRDGGEVVEVNTTDFALRQRGGKAA